MTASMLPPPLPSSAPRATPQAERGAPTRGLPQAGGDGPLADRYRSVRAASVRFASRLRPEDMVIQTMEDASPTKWHLAHTTWFFERFLLGDFVDGYTPHHPRYEFLFNSYYNTVGPQHCRANRGAISRPDVPEVLAYRDSVDAALIGWLESTADNLPEEARHRMAVGLNHEQQHQELMVTDLKYTLSTNPLLPAYHSRDIDTDSRDATRPRASACNFILLKGGLIEVGHDATSGGGFTYDNESPRHRVYLEPFELADRPVSNGEYHAFIADGGYERHELWLAEGWAWIKGKAITHPLYWYRDGSAPTGDGWMQYTLAGPALIDDAEPVVHLSFFEAEAFARWADALYPGARLPTESEWEHAASGVPVEGHFADTERYHPDPMTDDESNGRDATHPRSSSSEPATPPPLHHLFGTVWEWTRSAYGPYPGYRPAPGALGEYNGKFMANQYVLRGGSVATPPGHTRPTYRNFFNATARWQFTGLRLAKSARCDS